jgi:hypothetical protein
MPATLWRSGWTWNQRAARPLPERVPLVGISPAPEGSVRRRATWLLYLVPGLGFAIVVPLVLAYQAVRGELPMTPFGWRVMGGPFERIGTDRLTPLGVCLAAVLVGTGLVDVIAASGLRQGRRWGGRLALATTPISFALGIAFVVPFLLVVPPLRSILVAAGWRNLR